MKKKELEENETERIQGLLEHWNHYDFEGQIKNEFF
jgi:hypothetical protein